MNQWIDDFSEHVTGGRSCVLVTVAGIRGSTPRDTGAKMLVTEREIIGTIGGGQLEYRCAQIASKSLQDKQDGRYLRRFTLGANCGQCCGGIVEVLFESFCAEKPAWLGVLKKAHDRRESMLIATGQHTKYLIDAQGVCKYPPNSAIDDGLVAKALQILSQKKSAQRVKLNLSDIGDEDVLLEPVASSHQNVSIFGAGHVGAAAVHTLSSLDCNIRWIDNRRDIFPDHLPDNVQKIESERPELEVSAMPAGTCYLVMTHSHPLDQQIVQQILAREDFAYCGVIGSASKRRQFEKRLRKLGTAQARIDKMTCPIGIDGIDGKRPAEIAISVAAELLQILQAESDSVGEELPDNVRKLRQ